MRTEVINVTPEKAAYWLEQNKSNRNISYSRVNEYARAMLSGNWKLTHQGIAFNTNGDLIDGQHRLMAIRTAGILVDMNVTFGVEQHDGELLEIDVGRGRSYINILQMAGMSDPVYKESSKTALAFLHYKMGTMYCHAPAYVITDYIKRHYEELYFVCEAFSLLKKTKTRKPNAVVTAAALSALYGNENRDAIMKFGQVWRTNDTTCARTYNSKIALDCRDRVSIMQNSQEKLNYVENCIRCFANNLQIVRLIDCYKLDRSIVL